MRLSLDIKKKKVDSKNGLDRFEMGENAGQRRTQVPEPGLSGGGLGSWTAMGDTTGRKRQGHHRHRRQAQTPAWGLIFLIIGNTAESLPLLQRAKISRRAHFYEWQLSRMATSGIVKNRILTLYFKFLDPQVFLLFFETGLIILIKSALSIKITQNSIVNTSRIWATEFFHSLTIHLFSAHNVLRYWEYKDDKTLTRSSKSRGGDVRSEWAQCIILAETPTRCSYLGHLDYEGGDQEIGRIWATSRIMRSQAKPELLRGKRDRQRQTDIDTDRWEKGREEGRRQRKRKYTNEYLLSEDVPSGLFLQGTCGGWERVEGSGTGVISRGENADWPCFLESRKTWWNYGKVKIEAERKKNRGRERIRFGKIILTVREQFWASKTRGREMHAMEMDRRVKI